MPRRTPFLSALVLTCLLSTGCIAWSPVTVGPEVLLERPEPPQRIRVTRSDGVKLVLEAPVMRAGALVATAAPGAVLATDVEVIEVEKVSVTRTVGVLTPAFLLIALIGKQACRC